MHCVYIQFNPEPLNPNFNIDSKAYHVQATQVFGWQVPTAPTKAPTKGPTKAPTKALTKTPTEKPTRKPTNKPTKKPTKRTLPKACSKKTQYRTLFGCRGCVWTKSPFRRTVGSCTCHNPATLSAKSTKCSAVFVVIAYADVSWTSTEL